MSAFDKVQPKKSKKSKKIKKVFEELEQEQEEQQDTNIEISINEIDFEEETDDNDYENNEEDEEEEEIVIGENIEESESSDEEYDDLDEKFVDLTENDFHEDEEYDYFHRLDRKKKEEYIKNIEDINQITKSNVPLKFKVLKSAMDMDTKSIAITNINKLNEMDVSTGEYCKLDKWINGLINVPFGQYVNFTN